MFKGVLVASEEAVHVISSMYFWIKTSAFGVCLPLAGITLGSVSRILLDMLKFDRESVANVVERVIWESGRGVYVS